MEISGDIGDSLKHTITQDISMNYGLDISPEPSPTHVANKSLHLKTTEEQISPLQNKKTLLGMRRTKTFALEEIPFPRRA